MRQESKFEVRHTKATKASDTAFIGNYRIIINKKSISFDSLYRPALVTRKVIDALMSGELENTPAINEVDIYGIVLSKDLKIGVFVFKKGTEIRACWGGGIEIKMDEYFFRIEHYNRNFHDYTTREKVSKEWQFKGDKIQLDKKCIQVGCVRITRTDVKEIIKLMNKL